MLAPSRLSTGISGISLSPTVFSFPRGEVPNEEPHGHGLPVFLFLTTALALVAQKNQQASSPKATEKKEPVHADAGERAFQANCSRCHYAPEQLPPQITGTVVRHMRVRASLSAKDEQLILHFLTLRCLGLRRSTPLSNWRHMNLRNTLLTLTAIACLCGGWLCRPPVSAQESPKRIDIAAKRFNFNPGEVTLKKGEAVILVFNSSIRRTAFASWNSVWTRKSRRANQPKYRSHRRRRVTSLAAVQSSAARDTAGWPSRFT